MSQATLFPVAKGATISACELFRYALWRDWDTSLGRVCWVMLNPSTADAEQDDPTIRRCMGFARGWGYGGIVVVNIFGFRATKPADLLYADDVIGPDNDATIAEVIDSTLTRIVVCAWGQNAPLDRESEVLRLIQRQGVEPCALRLTRSGSPAHPLYLPKTLVPAPFIARTHATSTESQR